MQPPRLRTHRLLLREFRPEDVAAHREMSRDPDVQRFLGGVREPYEAFTNLATHAGHWALRGFGGWIVERGEDGAFLGRVGLWEPDGWPGTEIGWKLAREAWGGGYATEAARAVAGWAWTVLGLEQLISLIEPENTASARVAQRLGHVLDGPVELPLGKTERWVLARPPADEPWALRDATLEDAPRIATAVGEAFARYRDISPPGWAVREYGPAEELRVMAEPSYRCVLAEPGGVLAGHVGWGPAALSHHGSEDPELAHLRQLFLHPGWWGSGLAERLNAIALERARADGFRRMRLFTPAAQGRARRFYERHGWRMAGPAREDERFGMPTVEYRIEM